MFCFVDSRNRPHTIYLPFSRKSTGIFAQIKNNPLGATILHPDGRREYFENGLPKNLLASRDNVFRIKRGCHIKYQIRPLAVLDGMLEKSTKKNQPISQLEKSAHFSSFYVRQPEIFGLSSDYFSGCFFFLLYIPKKYGQSAAAEE